MKGKQWRTVALLGVATAAALLAPQVGVPLLVALLGGQPVVAPVQ